MLIFTLTPGDEASVYFVGPAKDLSCGRPLNGMFQDSAYVWSTVVTVVFCKAGLLQRHQRVAVKYELGGDGALHAPSRKQHRGASWDPATRTRCS